RRNVDGSGSSIRGGNHRYSGNPPDQSGRLHSRSDDLRGGRLLEASPSRRRPELPHQRPPQSGLSAATAGVYRAATVRERTLRTSFFSPAWPARIAPSSSLCSSVFST